MASFTSGTGVSPMKNRMQPPSITATEAKTPRLSRLETPRFFKLCEIQPPPSTTTMPNIHGKTLRFPPTVWL